MPRPTSRAASLDDQFHGSRPLQSSDFWPQNAGIPTAPNDSNFGNARLEPCTRGYRKELAATGVINEILRPSGWPASGHRYRASVTCGYAHSGRYGWLAGRISSQITRIRDSGERVIIDGSCFSACTLVTIIPKERICVTERAALGFHAGWIDDQKGMRPTSAEGTRLLFELYPPTIRSWINNHGGLGVQMIVLRGRELANLYPRCE